MTADRSFLTGGDIAPGRIKGADRFGELAAVFRAADFAVLNLERRSRGSTMSAFRHGPDSPELLNGHPQRT